jgi:hypothetical protein
MKLFTEYGGYKVSLIEQGGGSCLIWHYGDESQVVPLPEDVVYALMMLSERDNNA